MSDGTLMRWLLECHMPHLALEVLALHTNVLPVLCFCSLADEHHIRDRFTFLSCRIFTHVACCSHLVPHPSPVHRRTCSTAYPYTRASTHHRLFEPAWSKIVIIMLSPYSIPPSWRTRYETPRSQQWSSIGDTRVAKLFWHKSEVCRRHGWACRSQYC